jgi:hypothetical protein
LRNAGLLLTLDPNKHRADAVLLPASLRVCRRSLRLRNPERLSVMLTLGESLCLGFGYGQAKPIGELT